MACARCTHTLMHSPLWPTNKWSCHHFCEPGCKGAGRLEANNIYQNWKDVSKVISRLKHRMANRQKRPNKSSVADVALPSWICWVTWYMQLYNSLSFQPYILFTHWKWQLCTETRLDRWVTTKFPGIWSWMKTHKIWVTTNIHLGHVSIDYRYIIRNKITSIYTVS